MNGVARWRGLLPVLAALAVLPGSARGVAAQMLRGQVLDASNESRTIPQALVRLMDPDGEQLAASVSDPEGWYTLTLPGPGTYVIEAEALGWEGYESAPFSVGASSGTFRVDLLMEPSAIAIRGLEVDVDRMRRVRRAVQLSLGRDPSTLRNPPIGPLQINGHAERGRTLLDMLRFEDVTGLMVEDTPNYTCFRFRGGCLPLFFDEMEVNANAFAVGVPLALVELVVVLTPGETPVYPRGGVFVYSTAWLR